VLTNLPEGHEEQLTFSNHPKDESFGSRELPFAREVWIDREDFAKCRRRAGSAWCRVAKCACAAPASSAATK
jgi:glutamyl/glutaminyl-tRNA synthetase